MKRCKTPVSSFIFGQSARILRVWPVSCPRKEIQGKSGFKFLSILKQGPNLQCEFVLLRKIAKARRIRFIAKNCESEANSLYCEKLRKRSEFALLRKIARTKRIRFMAKNCESEAYSLYYEKLRKRSEFASQKNEELSLLFAFWRSKLAEKRKFSQKPRNCLSKIASKEGEY